MLWPTKVTRMMTEGSQRRSTLFFLLPIFVFVKQSRVMLEKQTHLLLLQLLLDLIAVTHTVDQRLGERRLDARQPRAQVAHLLVQLLHGHQRVLQLPHPAEWTRTRGHRPTLQPRSCWGNNPDLEIIQTLWILTFLWLWDTYTRFYLLDCWVKASEETTEPISHRFIGRKSIKDVAVLQLIYCINTTMYYKLKTCQNSSVKLIHYYFNKLACNWCLPIKIQQKFIFSFIRTFKLTVFFFKLFSAFILKDATEKQRRSEEATVGFGNFEPRSRLVAAGTVVGHLTYIWPGRCVTSGTRLHSSPPRRPLTHIHPPPPLLPPSSVCVTTSRAASGDSAGCRPTTGGASFPFDWEKLWSTSFHFYLFISFLSLFACKVQK